MRKEFGISEKLFDKKYAETVYIPLKCSRRNIGISGENACWYKFALEVFVQDFF